MLVDSLLKTTSLVDGVELASVDGKLEFGLGLQAPRRIATGIRSKFFFILFSNFLLNSSKYNIIFINIFILFLKSL